MASLHQRNAYVAVAVLLGSIPFGQRAIWSTAIGGAISLINLRLLDRSVVRLLGGAAQGGVSSARGLALRLLLHLRLAMLFLVVALALRSDRVDPIPFSIGLSSLVPAVLWHGWKTREG